MRHIVVVGCGFAGYHAAKILEEELAGRRRVKLTVVSRRDRFLYRPALWRIATGGLSSRRATVRLDELFASSTRLITDEIERIDPGEGQLVGADSTISYDYLIVATGGRRTPRVFEGAAALAGPDSLEEAVAIADQLDDLSSSAAPPIEVAVVGGSSTGVQWAAQLSADWPVSSDDVRIALYERESRLLPDHSPRLSAPVSASLRAMGVAVCSKHRIESATPTELRFDDGSHRTVDAAFHCAGRIGSALADNSGLSVDAKGRIAVDPDLGVSSHPQIFAAGDAASPPGSTPDSSNPQIAVQQGRQAARNLLAQMSGRAKKPFEFQHRGDFIELGPTDAALELRGMVLEGRAARWAYRVYYSAMIPRPLRKTRMLGEWLPESAGRLTADGEV